MNETSWKICNFVRSSTGGEACVTATQIAQGVSLDLGLVCSHLARLVRAGYFRRIYTRPTQYQWMGKVLPERPHSPGTPTELTHCTALDNLQVNAAVLRAVAALHQMTHDGVGARMGK